MDYELFTLFALGCAFFAGLIGSLTGLGGGAILAPLLVLLLKVDIHYAIGSALICSIATSTAASFPLLKKGIANPRIALFFGTATVFGAIAGSLLSALVPTTALFFLFGVVLLASCYPFKKKDFQLVPVTTFTKKWQLVGRYHGSHGNIAYACHNVKLGYSILVGAGLFSGLLGIGSGVFNVMALEKIMGLPFRVALATSTVIIGITTSSSVGYYLHWGYIDTTLVATVVIGVLLGSYVGSKLFFRAKTTALKALFTIVVIAMGIEMIHQGIDRLRHGNQVEYTHTASHSHPFDWLHLNR
ncbi:MAG: sulfite exporter TauE/SafE family protein [Parachlamydiales bacterium]|nr:sulfite exporter TauE/SafE family protein [Parachlamydiales bacterium]